MALTRGLYLPVFKNKMPRSETSPVAESPSPARDGDLLFTPMEKIPNKYFAIELKFKDSDAGVSYFSPTINGKSYDVMYVPDMSGEDRSGKMTATVITDENITVDAVATKNEDERYTHTLLVYYHNNYTDNNITIPISLDFSLNVPGTEMEYRVRHYDGLSYGIDLADVFDTPELIDTNADSSERSDTYSITGELFPVVGNHQF